MRLRFQGLESRLSDFNLSLDFLRSPILQRCWLNGFLCLSGTRLSGGNEPEKGLQTIFLLHSWGCLWRITNSKLKHVNPGLSLSTVLFTAKLCKPSAELVPISSTRYGDTRLWISLGMGTVHQLVLMQHYVIVQSYLKACSQQGLVSCSLMICTLSLCSGPRPIWECMVLAYAALCPLLAVVWGRDPCLCAQLTTGAWSE